MVDAEPSERDRKRFKDAQVLGNVDISEFSGIKEKLSSNEEVSLIAGLDTDRIPGLSREKGKKMLVVTNLRLLAYSSQNVRLLGEKSTFKDIDIDSVKEMDVEERDGFDRVKVTTKRGTETFMAPEGAGVKITGRIRELQEHGDPMDELERLSEQHDKGNIGDDEYRKKKEELLRRI
ncbi:MAG: SHOCT domain-containing protein [Candidatus Nanohaloarchaea archaeon]|nr:SHOCT domain-containing protein [Candidatus Nanohaloarchaea archaeon]